MIQEEQQSHQQAQQMQSSQQVPQPQQPQAPLLEEDSSGIDILEWVFRIIDHWYLFVIAAIIAFSLAYLKNRKVIRLWGSFLQSGVAVDSSTKLGMTNQVSWIFRSLSNHQAAPENSHLPRRSCDFAPDCAFL